MATANKFEGKILSVSDEIRQKTNGKSYIIGTAEINVKGKTLNVTFQYTLEDAKGESKEMLQIGQNVILYHSALPSTKEEGGTQHFFEVARGVVASSNAEISEVLGSVLETTTADVAQEAITA